MPTDLGKMQPPVGRAVEFVQLTRLVDLRHQQPTRLVAAPVTQYRFGPSSDLAERRRFLLDHRVELAKLLFGQRRLVINLGDLRCVAIDFVDVALAALANAVAQSNRVALRVR